MKSGILSHIVAVLMLPFTGLVIIPALMLYLTNDMDGVWAWEYPATAPGITAGAFLTVIGLYLLISTIRLFAVVGKGTLAPWEPPQELVVTGIYRRVRNPKISGVLIVLLGEAVLFSSVAVSIWFALFFVGNIIYFRFCEEPDLVERFGDEYIEYRRNVPGWVPMVKPWTKTDR